MNDFEAERIAAAINVLRPDWPTRSLITLMKRPQLASRPRRDVAVALAWIACETNTANPGRVLETGPWWRAAATDTPGAGRPHPLRRDQECPAHPGHLATNCGGCAADRLAEDRPAPPPRAWDPGDAKAGADAARAALLAARGQTTEEDAC